ncbi:hypothetical protein Pst134EA_011490 [Puccinia striiformis f. sp. tritici]|uniref:Uncharacterized protein n=2 Tax=Puccinia striiformis TaxID=27350 RepID=A0A0L0UZU0_9BASI|nr:hypothetical protein Pst134EA_011490 [Puccinia striiformis f. sp. tritici]KAH9456268.1 hypothetical protein Pst134EB_012471 [Puccinia striiformis f. sp. tritici]KAH9467872.1 hypothetical protein Pst134EA_011490 [Puccinia striiformis f. sp. tritici]KAI9608368.1 hypothetical protein KEM48_003303 [Puccinia striiformis f. sp. tritici PST-130]KNE92548.1 hypothetical protein PSTG_14056 [Puccinia striiformis f. sp. tritici PST-78]
MVSIDRIRRLPNLLWSSDTQRDYINSRTQVTRGLMLACILLHGVSSMILAPKTAVAADALGGGLKVGQNLDSIAGATKGAGSIVDSTTSMRGTGSAALKTEDLTKLRGGSEAGQLEKTQDASKLGDVAAEPKVAASAAAEEPVTPLDMNKIFATLDTSHEEILASDRAKNGGNIVPTVTKAGASKRPKYVPKLTTIQSGKELPDVVSTAVIARPQSWLQQLREAKWIKNLFNRGSTSNYEGLIPFLFNKWASRIARTS